MWSPDNESERFPPISSSSPSPNKNYSRATSALSPITKMGSRSPSPSKLFRSPPRHTTNTPFSKYMYSAVGVGELEHIMGERHVPMLDPEDDIMDIFPNPLHFGIVACGFLYVMTFTVKNFTAIPLRVKVSVKPANFEDNSIRMLYPLDVIAPGMSVTGKLELTAEFPGSSIFAMTISQDQSSEVAQREIHATIVTQDTFKHVKKSLELQKRPIYRHNIEISGNIPTFDSFAMDMTGSKSAATHSEDAIMDEEDIENLLDIPMAPNLSWDPFSKQLRLDPQLGKVIVDPTLTMEEMKEANKELIKERMNALEEQGFLTTNSLGAIREDKQAALETLSSQTSQDTSMSDDIDEPGHSATLRTMSNLTHAMATITSLLALKRERIEKQRKESILKASMFAKESEESSMVDSMRTLHSVQRRRNTVVPVKLV